MKLYKASEQHDNLVSKSYGKYDDMRMPWTGRHTGYPRTFAITDVTQIVAPIDESRVWILLTNDGAANPIYLNFGEDAVANSCCRLNANGGSILLDRNSPWANYITAICGAGLTSTLLVNDIAQETESGRGE